ncbi:MAG: xylulokinase, partial [Christensenellaceae bacterium]|nr:xylulokinase [Christensenellaceae bacterium]
AAKSPVGSNGLLFLPYLLGERAPHWDPNARGTFIGLTMKHTMADMQHAVLEGVALNLGLIYHLEEENGVSRQGLHKAIGVCVNSPIVAQALADIYGQPIALTDMSDEATSLGAAILAGAGVGLFPDHNVSERFNHVTKIIEPIPANVEKYKEILPVFQQAYDSLKETYRHLRKLQS